MSPSGIDVGGRAWRQHGASIVEFTLVVPLLLFLVLGAIQAALAFHAKSNLNYAAFQAARSGSVLHAEPKAMFNAFARSLVPYFGGGEDTAALAEKLAAVHADLAQGSARMEILSPTSRSFDDYNSPELAARLGGGKRAIPTVNILNLHCPRDRPGCASDPATNASGQSLQDASLLAIRITYGIPPQKQVPLAGKFYSASLRLLGIGRDDEFIASLLEQGRIPIVARAVVRMANEPVEEAAVSISNAFTFQSATDGVHGSGGAGGSGSGSGGGSGDGPSGPTPPRCRPGDARCDPDCGVRLCCVTPKFPQ